MYYDSSYGSSNASDSRHSLDHQRKGRSEAGPWRPSILLAVTATCPGSHGVYHHGTIGHFTSKMTTGQRMGTALERSTVFNIRSIALIRGWKDEK